MASVTRRIKEIDQPYGGFLKVSEFEKEKIVDNEILGEENIYSSLTGLVVDYLTRLMLDVPPEEAFKISLLGASIINKSENANRLLKSIKGLDDNSIYCACQLVGYDVCYRSSPMRYKNVEEIKADANTIGNIKIMVKRSILFFNKYGPITKAGFSFDGGYTSVITAGDGDFLTPDTLWDFKVSINEPTSDQTLQLLIYYIMGNHSIHPEFKSIKNLGIFNPRINCVYLKKISDIPQKTIEQVATDVIGYNNLFNENNVYSNVTIEKSDNLLTMLEIMKILSCTRYMVLKYYAEYDLPLIMIKNKYYIYQQDLNEWIEKINAEREKEQKEIRIYTIFVIIFIIVVFCVTFMIMQGYININ